MRKLCAAITAVAATAVLAGCGGGGAWPPGSVGSSTRYGDSAASIAARLGCTGVTPNDDDSNDVLPRAFRPTEDVTCTFAGKSTDISTYAKASAEQGSIKYVDRLAGSFGVGAYIASGNGWIAGLVGDDEDDESSGPATPAQKDFSQKIVDQLGGRVIKVGD